MSFHALMGLLITVFFISGCGQDVANNKKSRRNAGTQDRPGLGTEEAIPVLSQIHRLRGINTITYASEAALTLAGTMPAAYKPVPDMELDDEGTSGKNIISVQGLGRPGIACGVGDNFTGINGRIADCKLKNGNAAQWSGLQYGAAGEGSWKLVALTADGKETWFDLITGMVWTDVIATANWCKASGNKQTATGLAQVDCAVVGENESLCFGANVAGLGTNVRWRLPTRGDYLQADLNGLRFILKPGSTIGAWTATLVAASAGHQHGWVYHIQDGTLSAQELTSERHVRCIGVPLR